MRIHLFRPIKVTVAACLLAISIASATDTCRAQSAPEPRQEALLNSLRVLIWSQPAAANVSITLRVHSGAAFDLAGKTGTMALLSDQLFPDPETRDFFTEELGGQLDVSIEYHSINIRMTGRASEFERMLGLLRTALIGAPITNENVVRLRELRTKMIREMGVAPSFVADRAIAKRLYGDFPYGRPVDGTAETLARIDRADLLLARERFMTPDNATIAIIGGVQESRALRALRQLLGTWRKGDRIVPSTYRMPDAPDVRTLIVDIPGAEGVDLRLATRSVSRSDPDYYVAMLLPYVLRDRWQSAAPEQSRTASFVRNDSYLLSGILVMGASVPTPEASKVIESARKSIRSLVESPTSASELERARAEALALLSKKYNEPQTVAERWLDRETNKLSSNVDAVNAINKITIADIQRVAGRLFREGSFASVAVGNEAQLRTDFERAGKVEVSGERRETNSSTTVPASKNP